MSEKIEDGGPAFPVPTHSQLQGAMVHWSWGGGMTLRDWFAGQVLAGLLANPGGPIQANARCGWGLENCKESDVAGYAYHIADAMIEARRSR